ncbi:MAG: hypothetical protein ACOVQR_08295 [Flavobacterium sp.]
MLRVKKISVVVLLFWVGLGYAQLTTVTNKTAYPFWIQVPIK